MPRSAIHSLIRSGYVSPGRGRRRQYEFSFQDLADWAHRQLADDFQPLGQLERCDVLLPQERDQLVDLDRLARFGHDERAGLFAEQGIGHRDQRHYLDLGMRVDLPTAGRQVKKDPPRGFHGTA